MDPIARLQIFCALAGFVFGAILFTVVSTGVSSMLVFWCIMLYVCYRGAKRATSELRENK